MKQLIYFCVFACFFLTSTMAVAQSNCNCESFTPDRQQKFEQENLKQNINAGFEVINQIKEGKSACCLAIAHSMEAILLNTAGKAQASFDSAKLAIKFLGENSNDYVALEGYRMMGIGYNRKGNFDSAVYCYFKSLEKAETLGKNSFLPKLYANISLVYINQKQIDKGLFFQKKSLQAATQVKDINAMAQCYANLVTVYGNMYEQTNDKAYLDSAKNTAPTALRFARETDQSILIIRNHLSLTKFALADSSFTKAKAHSDTLLTLVSDKTNPAILYSVYVDRGEISLGLNDPKEAVISFERAKDYSVQSHNIFTNKLIYNKLWSAYKANGETNKALGYLEKYKTLNDSLVNVDNARIIDEMEQKYYQAKNERTIKELAQEKQIYLLIAIAGVLAVAAIGFYLRQLSLKHKKGILETEQRLNRARMNPHFFFNALTALQKFAMAGADGNVMASNLSKFSHIMRETLESTYKEYVTIEQEMEFLKEYLEVQRLRFPQAFTFEIAADDKLDISDLLIPSMIIQPFVENTIEHGFGGLTYPGFVRIYFSGTEQEIKIEIKDNGKGLIANRKENNEHISRASQIIKDRIYLLNIKLKSKAGFSIDNIGEGTGVIVKINLPVLTTSSN